MWPTPAVLDSLLAGFYLFVGVYHAMLYLRRREMIAYRRLAPLCAGAPTVNFSATLAGSGLAAPRIGWLKGLNTAACLELACLPGRGLMSETVARHAVGLGTRGPVEEVVLKGHPAPVRVRVLEPHLPPQT
jgi:hypothetical protein